MLDYVEWFIYYRVHTPFLLENSMTFQGYFLVFPGPTLSKTVNDSK